MGEHVIQRLLIMGGQTAAAKGFHGKNALSRLMTGRNGLHHFFTGGKLVALADAQSGIIDEGEDHVQLRNICRRRSDVHMVGGKADSPHQPLGFGVDKSLPRTFSLLQLARAHLVHEENIDDLTAQRLLGFQNGLRHAIIVGTQGFGAQHHLLEVAALQRHADIGIGAVILGGVDEIDVPLQPVANDGGTFLQG